MVKKKKKRKNMVGWEKRISTQNSLLLTPGRVFRYHVADFPTATTVTHLGYIFAGHQWLIEGVRALFGVLINTIVLFLRFSLLTTADPALTHQQLPWLSVVTMPWPFPSCMHAHSSTTKYLSLHLS